jgi:HK97 family phage portal protein
MILDHRGDPIETKALDLTTFPLDLLASPVLSGVSVTPQSALGVPAVANAVSLISGACGTLPLWIYREEGQGKIWASDHPASGVVSDQANDWTSSSALRTQLAVDALLHGNGYAVVNRLASGAPFELLRLDPQSVTVYYNPATLEPSYEWRPMSVGAHGSRAQANHSTPDSQERTYSWAEIIHIRAPLSIDGICGVSPISAAREAIGLAITLEAYAARLFGRGARPSGILKFDTKLDAATAARMKDSWQSAHSGSNSGGTAVIEQGGEFQPITLNSVDAQFHEMRLLQTVEIARAFNISPALIGDLSRATWSNLEQSNRQLLQLTLLPWLRNFESQYRRVFLSSEERKTYSITFDTSELLQGDTAARGEFLAKMRSNGIFTANECRAYESLPAHADGATLESPHVQSANAPTPQKEAA